MPNRDPREWLRHVDTQRLLAEFEREQKQRNVGENHIPPVHTAKGYNGGTWAHKDIALAYAAYLSPSFHLWVLRVALKQMETGGPPTEDRARPMGEIFADELAKLQRSADGLHRRLNRLNANDAHIVERSSPRQSFQPA